jgi:hypothetical protein
MKAEHEITKLQKRNLDIESVFDSQSAALMTVTQESSKALAVKDAEIEHLKCVHGNICAEKQALKDEVERMKLAQEESTQAIEKMEKKRSQRGAGTLGPGAGTLPTGADARDLFFSIFTIACVDSSCAIFILSTSSCKACFSALV